MVNKNIGNHILPLSINKKTIIIFLALIFSVNLLNAQDSSRSILYKPKPFAPKKHPVIKYFYHTYSLIDGYRLLEKAKSGDPIAQHELGLRMLLGFGFPKDTLKAVEWIKKTADENLTAAKFNYAIMLSNNIGVKWNPFEAYKNIKAAAEDGMPIAQYALGLYYTDNLVVNKNLDKAYKWLRLSAKKGFTEAQKVIDEMIKNGYLPTDTEDTTQNESRKQIDDRTLLTNQWEFDYLNSKTDSLTKSENEKNLETFLAKTSNEIRKVLNVDTTETTTETDIKKINIIRRAADNGSPEALLIYARYLEKGISVKKDITLALENYIRAFRLGNFKAADKLLRLTKDNQIFTLLKKEVNKNNPHAMYAWAGLVALGFNRSITNKQAFELFQKAKNLNHIPSIIEMGLCYSTGTLVEKNLDEAIKIWQQAAQIGSIEAKVRIAMLKIYSRKKDQDLKNEIELFERASKSGLVLAETALGYCYQKGIGVEENKAIANKLYRIATNRGNRRAYDLLKKMYDEIRTDEKEFTIY